MGMEIRNPSSVFCLSWYPAEPSDSPHITDYPTILTPMYFVQLGTKQPVENTAATSHGSNPPPNLIASQEPTIQQKSYHPWIRARDDVSYHHFRRHCTLLDQGTDGEVGGGKKKKRSQSKRNISPPALGHCTDTTLGHPASQSGGFKKYQTRSMNRFYSRVKF